MFGYSSQMQEDAHRARYDEEFEVHTSSDYTLPLTQSPFPYLSHSYFFYIYFTIGIAQLDGSPLKHLS